MLDFSKGVLYLLEVLLYILANSEKLAYGK